MEGLKKSIVKRFQMPFNKCLESGIFIDFINYGCQTEVEEKMAS